MTNERRRVENFLLVGKVFFLLCRKFEKFWIAFANLFTTRGLANKILRKDQSYNKSSSIQIPIQSPYNNCFLPPTFSLVWDEVHLMGSFFNKLVKGFLIHIILLTFVQNEWQFLHFCTNVYKFDYLLSKNIHKFIKICTNKRQF